MTSTTPPTIETPERPDPSAAPHRGPAATRAPRDSITALPHALGSEWTKLRSLRSNLGILWGTTAVGVVLVWILAVFVKTDSTTGETYTIGNSFSFPTWLSTVMAVIAGILVVTSEVQHGTLAGAITAQPARWVIVAAKTVTAAGFGLAMGAAGMLAGVTGGLLGGLQAGDTSGMPATVAWGLLLTTVAATFGLGIGMVVRSSAAAISVTLVWVFVIENLARGLASPTLYRYLPFNPPNGLLDIPITADPEALALAFTRVQDAMLFSGYTLTALAVGGVLLYRRDLN